MFWWTLWLACTGKALDSSTPEEISPTWRVVEENLPQGVLMSVWGGTDDDVWVVGGQYDQGFVLRGSGDTWTEVPIPEQTPLLNWVHGLSSEDVWVAGLSGALIHWNGREWTDHSLDITESFWGVFVQSSDRVIAVGGESRWGGETARIYFYDGQSWTETDLPAEWQGASNLFKASYVDDQFWMVGASGASLFGTEQGVTSVPTGMTTDLITVHKHENREEGVVVGGRGTGLIATISSGQLQSVQQFPAGLNGVYALGDGRAVVVGERGYGAIYDIETGDTTEITSVTLDVLHATFVDSSSVDQKPAGESSSDQLIRSNEVLKSHETM